MTSYQLKIALTDAKDLFEHGINFTVIIPSDITFLQLHKVIMAATNYEDYHLWRFVFLDGAIDIQSFDEDVNEAHLQYNQIKTLKADLLIISEIFFDYEYCEYIYDFGDYNKFDIRLEKTINSKEIPRIIDFNGKFPPEDVGSINGYRQLLKALNAKYPSKSQRHLRHWIKKMKYEDFDKEKIDNNIRLIVNWNTNE